VDVLKSGPQQLWVALGGERDMHTNQSKFSWPFFPAISDPVLFVICIIKSRYFRHSSYVVVDVFKSLCFNPREFYCNREHVRVWKVIHTRKMGNILQIFAGDGERYVLDSAPGYLAGGQKIRIDIVDLDCVIDELLIMPLRHQNRRVSLTCQVKYA